MLPVDIPNIKIVKNAKFKYLIGCGGYEFLSKLLNECRQKPIRQLFNPH